MIDLAFEIGHTLIKYHNNLEEFEKVASGNGLVKLFQDNYLMIDSAKEFFDLCEKKDPLALNILEEWEDIVSLYIANLQMDYNTDKVCLSGGVMKSSRLFLEALEKKSNELISRFPLKPIKIVLAQFDQDAGLMGGVSVALHIK